MSIPSWKVRECACVPCMYACFPCMRATMHLFEEHRELRCVETTATINVRCLRKMMVSTATIDVRCFETTRSWRTRGVGTVMVQRWSSAGAVMCPKVLE